MNAKRPRCLKCGKRITDVEAEASRLCYGPEADLCEGCAKSLAAAVPAIRKGPAPRSFQQACFHYASEFCGQQYSVAIDGQKFSSAVAVAVRDDPGPDQVQGTVAGYELTLFDFLGQWRQLVFNPQGELIEELVGDPAKPPRISRSREVL